MWVEILYYSVEFTAIILVGIGLIPLVALVANTLAMIQHAFVNHYSETQQYRPRVAVLIPAWNEGLVLGQSVDRMLNLDYPEQSLRVYVVDDASTDNTPEVIDERALLNPGRVINVRREVGGQGKAHTLNAGIERALTDDWAEAILIMDADVVFRKDALAKMTRHLSDDKVGAVTAYISEGTGRKNWLNRFITVEYILSQLLIRRAQNVTGGMICLAGGAQLHSRANLRAIGGKIPTGSLAEDTVTTFEGQIRGRKMIFEPHAVVLAEEPRDVVGLWKQRVRWARGNVQITSMYKHLWFRRSSQHKLGHVLFGITWFSILMLPFMLLAASVGLITLLLIESSYTTVLSDVIWITVPLIFIYAMLLSVQLDIKNARKCLLEVVLFPGLGSLFLIANAAFPHIITGIVADFTHHRVNLTEGNIIAVAFYLWGIIALLGAWLAHKIEPIRGGRFLAAAMIYTFGYGALLCAITVQSFVLEWRNADAKWEKTEKLGRISTDST